MSGALLPEKGPPRLLAATMTVTMIGYGAFLTSGVLYFTRVVGLPTAQVGIGLSIAGLAALAAGVPVGHWADRRGARGAYAAMLLCEAAGMAGLCFVHEFWSFLACVCLGGAAHTAGPAARGPLVQEYGGARPAAFRGYLRSVTNLGIAAGAVLAGWVVQADTREAYLLLNAGTAVSYAGCAAVVLLLPAVPLRPPAPEGRWIALRDGPYLLLTTLDGLMAVQYRVLTTVVPLWLVTRSAAPHWSVSAVMVVNTALVVLLQVRAGRHVDTPRAGGLAFRRAGFAFLVSCAALSALPALPPWPTIALLLTAVVVHTAGEIWHAAGGFEVSFALAPAHAVGQYQGVFGMGLGFGMTVGPALLIALCLGMGVPGWWIVGGFFALTGLAVPPAVRWADRRRVRDPRPGRTPASIEPRPAERNA
jgi:hypothetical protein